MLDINNAQKNNLYRVCLVFLIILSLYFGVKFLAEFKSYGMSGSGGVNTISLSGHGEVKAVPNIADVSFVIIKEAKTVKEAQNSVTQIEKKVLAFLKENNILEKDIKTTNTSFYPKYDYGNPCVNAYPHPCDPIKPKITGYEVSESVTIKIRNTDEAGKTIQGLGTLGVSSLTGPNFAIDDEDSLKAEARKKAIDDAKGKAEKLALDLGVHLGRIASFNESGNYAMPMMYAKGAMADSVSSAPILPKGENIISSDITITYEIR